MNPTETTSQPAEAAAPVPTRPTISVQLEEPVKRAGGDVSAVTVRRPRVGDLRGLNLMDVVQMKTEALVTLLPRVTSPTLVAHEIENMCPADFTNLASEVVLFFAPKATAAQVSPQP